MSEPIIFPAPAKINLTLDVLGRRTDGYHEIETVMQTLELADRVTLEDASGLEVYAKVSLGEPCPPHGPDNLAYKAAVALGEAVGCPKGARIIIEKNIPMAAGLAGGSADAAAALHGLNDLWELGLSQTQLEAIGAKIGSDVPFCLRGGTVMGRGRGEILEDLPSLPRALWVVLINPRWPLSTAEVYRAWAENHTPRGPMSADFLVALRSGDPGQMAVRMGNALAAAAQGLCPPIKEILTRLGQFSGMLGVCLSGSGPTVFGLAVEQEAAQMAAANFAAQGYWTALTRTSGRRENASGGRI